MLSVTISRMEAFLEDFEAHLSNPEDYLKPTPELRAHCLAGVKTLFDALQKRCRNPASLTSSDENCQKSKAKKLNAIPTGPLPELYTEGFDIDQIWEQIQLVNEPLIGHLTKQVEKMSKWDFAKATDSCRSKNEVPVVSDPDSDGVGDLESDFEEGYEDFSVGGDGGDELQSGDEDGEEFKEKKGKERGRRTVVDDRFFKLAEMEAFLEKVEQEQQKQQGW